MASDLYSSLLAEIGEAYGLKLLPNANNTCQIPLPGGIKLNLEISSDGRFFLIGCPVGHVPSGIFGEEVFKAALKYNGAPEPKAGVFGYSEKADLLFFHKNIILKDINGAKIAAAIPAFVEIVKEWHDDIEHGRVPSVRYEEFRSNSGWSPFNASR